jgi:hypothetical protein
MLLKTLDPICQCIKFKLRASLQDGTNCSPSEAKFPTVVHITLLSLGIMSKHIIYQISIRFYVYGGQDLKEGSFGDMWKLSVDYMYNDAVKVDAEEGTEIEGKEWK